MSEEYIRKKDMSDWLKQYGQDVLHGKYKVSLMYIWKNLTDLPSADVASVVYAHWIDGYRWQTCSKCRNKGKRSWKFCPNCGAKMDGGDEHG